MLLLIYRFNNASIAAAKDASHSRYVLPFTSDVHTDADHTYFRARASSTDKAARGSASPSPQHISGMGAWLSFRHGQELERDIFKEPPALLRMGLPTVQHAARSPGPISRLGAIQVERQSLAANFEESYHSHSPVLTN